MSPRPPARLVLHALPRGVADHLVDAARRQTLFALDVVVAGPDGGYETDDAVTLFDVYVHGAIDRGRASALDSRRAVITVVPPCEGTDVWPLRDGDACLIEGTISPDALATALFQAAFVVTQGDGGARIHEAWTHRCVPRRTFAQVLHHAISVAGRSGTIGYVIAIAALPRASSDRITTGLTQDVLQRILSTTRAADLVGLFGPCHFGVLVETGSTLEGAHTLLDRLRQALSSDAGEGAALDLHFGLTTFGAAADTPSLVLDRADAALAQSLAQAQRAGRSGGAGGPRPG